MANKWQANRAGILNYWYYDETEFQFAGGRLLLRGSNGSGKSVTMQSLVTVLLDGQTRASRLDSFGTTSRRIEDYLLGEREITGIDERIGYLYLEYKREGTDQYVTTGIGLRAKRGTGRVDFWGFVLTNGARIGRDLLLYRHQRDAATGELKRMPLTQTELKNRLAADKLGQFAPDRRTYRELVNRYIYGFHDIAQFEELIDLLIQLRSPKLSRDFRPAVIYDILNRSLPALTEEDLRPLSRTMELIDNTQSALRELEEERKALAELSRVYAKYNEAVLGQRLLVQKKHGQLLRAIDREIERKTAEEKAAREEREAAEAEHSALLLEQRKLEEEKKVLEDNEAWRAAEEKKEKEDTLVRRKKSHEAREADWQEKRRRELQTEERRKSRSEAMGEAEERAREELGEMDALAREARFSAHGVQKEGLALSSLTDTRAANWKEEVRTYETHLGEVLQKLRQVKELMERAQTLQREVGEEQRLLDEQRAEWAHIQGALDRARNDLVKAYYLWKKEVAPFTVQRETELVAILQGLYRDGTWQEALELLGLSVAAAQQDINASLGTLRAQATALEEQRQEAEAELARLRSQKEAEIELTPAVAASREALRARGIAFIPFYEATEFREEVEPSLRERIESALFQAGVLNALILEDETALDGSDSPVADRILRAKEPVVLGDSLFSYLRPADGVDEVQVAAILSSIAVTAGAFPEATGDQMVIDVAAGGWAMAQLAGHAPQEEAARYIGKRAREELRRREIAACEERIAGLGRELEALQGEREALEEKLRQTEEARRAFPSDEACAAQQSALRAAEIAIEAQEGRLAEKNERHRAALDALRGERDTLRRLREGDRLEPTGEAYQGALEAMKEYKEALHDLLIAQKDYAAAHADIQVLETQLAEIREEEDRLRGEIEELAEEIEALTARLAALEKVLKDLGAEKLQARIAQIVGRLRELPEAQGLAIRREAQAEEALRHLEQDIARARLRQRLRTQLKAAADTLVEAELAHAFLPEKLVDRRGTQELLEKRRAENAPTLMRLWNGVTKSYQDGQSILSQYRAELLDEETKLAEPAAEELDESLAAENQSAWQELKELSVRSLVVLHHGGRRSPQEELAALDSRLESQRLLLSEQDQQIYKEVMVNSVGRTISEYIYAASAWVKKMNKLMQERSTSSGLKFHLAWKVLKGEENGMETQDIIRLLGQDAALLSDEDRKRVGRYFRERLERARALARDETAGSGDWIEAVRTSLDYRQWYAFKLSYDKGEGIKDRPLSDAAFNQFSGGERAMAMYTPLFSAAYSRYQEAAEDAPYLITLDEAFAGVDERNMREMFSLVESLGFNYIMNSQAIWGTYDVVPELNIYELLRPQGAPFVSTAQFHWDGKACTLVTERAEEPEKEEQDA